MRRSRDDSDAAPAFQLVAGAFVDRWNRRATMLVCDGLNAAAVASIPVAYAFGALSFWQLLVVAFADRNEP